MCVCADAVAVHYLHFMALLARTTIKAPVCRCSCDGNVAAFGRTFLCPLPVSMAWGRVSVVVVVVVVVAMMFWSPLTKTHSSSSTKSICGMSPWQWINWFVVLSFSAKISVWSCQNVKCVARANTSLMEATFFQLLLKGNQCCALRLLLLLRANNGLVTASVASVANVSNVSEWCFTPALPADFLSSSQSKN